MGLFEPHTLTDDRSPMPDVDIADRLAALPALADIPRAELEWLVRHGHVEVHEAGAVIAPKGRPIEKLWIILSGHIAVRVDRGAGPRRVTEWRTGEVSGMLPYSRMRGPPGDNYLEERTEILTIREEHFPEMVHRCPAFTAYTVHSMLDRARSFNASDLHDEKMMSLGKLAAGLAHELNNPASATVRGAKLLTSGLAGADEASRALGAAALSGATIDTIESFRTACLADSAGTGLSPIDRADREDEIADWLAAHQCDPALAATFVDTAVTIEALSDLAGAVSGAALDTVLRWVAANCTTHALARDIERTAARIYDLVAAVKKFTYMDKMAGPELVDVAAGIRETIRIVSAKAESKRVAISLDVEARLPRVEATGGELNQIWLNLIDNALDAIEESGTIEIAARAELDRVVVRVVDSGPGIPDEVLPRIFDPFFTTKPPGQGTGLGLDITRRLLRRYYGEIAVESRPGRTEFRVSLMAEKPESTDADASQRRE